MGGLGQELAGVLHLPPGRPQAFALFAHCFTGGKDFKASVHLSRALEDEGYGVLRFDFTGLGESEGDFADTTFSSNLDDLAAAAGFLRHEYQAPRLMVGHSLGGTAVLHACDRVPECVAVATIGSPYDPEHVQHLFGDHMDAIARDGAAVVNLGGRKIRIKKAFLEDLGRHPEGEVMRNLDRALLIMHSPGDRVVGIENAGLLYAAARHPKSFASLDDADHLLRRRRDAQYAGRLLAAWASRYVSET